MAFIDFGMSTRYDPTTDSSSWTDSKSIGTLCYVAPEVLSANDTKKEYQVLPADVGEITLIKNFVMLTFVLQGICFSEGLERLPTGGTRSTSGPSWGQLWTFSYLCLLRVDHRKPIR